MRTKGSLSKGIGYKAVKDRSTRGDYTANNAQIRDEKPSKKLRRPKGVGCRISDDKSYGYCPTKELLKDTFSELKGVVETIEEKLTDSADKKQEAHQKTFSWRDTLKAHAIAVKIIDAHDAIKTLSDAARMKTNRDIIQHAHEGIRKLKISHEVITEMLLCATAELGQCLQTVLIVMTRLVKEALAEQLKKDSKK